MTEGLQQTNGCVISSFITKPQPCAYQCTPFFVALYPLSSPNHNIVRPCKHVLMLRYILFHHQTTTFRFCSSCAFSCVISSFITKPQLALIILERNDSCVISSFITKPQLRCEIKKCHFVALYPLSSPNHNLADANKCLLVLRYILFHHQTTTLTTQY